MYVYICMYIFVCICIYADMLRFFGYFCGETQICIENKAKECSYLKTCTYEQRP